MGDWGGCGGEEGLDGEGKGCGRLGLVAAASSLSFVLVWDKCVNA